MRMKLSTCLTTAALIRNEQVIVLSRIYAFNVTQEDGLDVRTSLFDVAGQRQVIRRTKGQA